MHDIMRLVCCLLILIPLAAEAQQAESSTANAAASLLPALPPELLEQLQQTVSRQNAAKESAPPATDQQRQTRDIVAGKSPNTVAPGAAAFERDFSARAGMPLRIFGADVFAEPASQSPAAGAIKDSYQLGIGDEIDVELRGPISRSLTGRVGRDGTLLLTGLPPVAALGEGFGAVRTALIDVAHRTLGNVDVYVSLAAVHEIAVLMTGTVRDPGIRRLDPFATILNALSGEFLPDASLRGIQLTHQSMTRSIDLYPLLTGGRVPAELGLSDGDQIFVPSVKTVVAIAGEVARPAIYEVPAAGITAAALIDLAGGLVRPSGNRLLRLSLDPVGRDHASAIQNPSDTRLKPSDILLVERGESVQLGEVQLDGDVRVPGPRALAMAPTLAALLPPDQLSVDPYLPFIIIISVEPKMLTRSLSGVDFGDAARDYDLRSGDTVVVLSRDEIDYLGSPDVQAILQRNTPATIDCPGLKRLANLVAQDGGGRFSNAIRAIQVAAGTSPPCPGNFAKYPALGRKVSAGHSGSLTPA